MKNSSNVLRASEVNSRRVNGKVREIGSEFWDVPTCDDENNLFPENAEWFLSGRSALRAIIRDIEKNRARNVESPRSLRSTKSVSHVALPSWCCDSIIKPFLDARIEVLFYSVYFANDLIQDIRFDCDILLLMDYFGYSSQPPNLSDYEGVVIRDVTHSIFSNTYSDADYYFGSLRKWCGFWTGGFAWTRDKHSLLLTPSQEIESGEHTKIFVNDYVTFREKAMKVKERYINGLEAKKDYLAIFNEAEMYLEESVDVLPSTERDIQLAKRLNTDNIKKQRRANAYVLMENLPREWLIFPKMKDTDCPMFVPILVPHRNELKTYLIENEIYCPVHWPMSEFHGNLDEGTAFLYENEISLVCDQRYGEEDMERAIKIIKR